MKTTLLSLICAALSSGFAKAQDPKGGQALFQSQTPKTEKSQKPASVKPQKATGHILGHKVVYGGYLVDYSQAEKKRPLFNLRLPVDPQKDTENLWYYPGTDKIQGVVFFSIKF
jgi:hypothetical protein